VVNKKETLMKNIVFCALIGTAALVAGCGDEASTPTAGGTANTPAQSSEPTAAPSTAAAAPHNRIRIGEKTVGSLKLVATMDAPVKAAGGGEGAFDVVITGGKPKAVRFWVGSQDAKGSVKAKAEEETTDNWHAHAEVPSPLPPNSRFWVEVEPPTGETFVESFDLRTE
jgi:hypothetical protein